MSSKDVEQGTLGESIGMGKQDVTSIHSRDNNSKEIGDDSISGGSRSNGTDSVLGHKDSANKTKRGTATVAATSHSSEDDFDGDDDAYHKSFPMREVQHDFPFFSDICAYNPVVSGIAIVVLWGFSVWCMGKLYHFFNAKFV